MSISPLHEDYRISAAFRNVFEVWRQAYPVWHIGSIDGAADDLG
jgi:hypothetical protein